MSDGSLLRARRAREIAVILRGRPRHRNRIYMALGRGGTLGFTDVRRFVRNCPFGSSCDARGKQRTWTTVLRSSPRELRSWSSRAVAISTGFKFTRGNAISMPTGAVTALEPSDLGKEVASPVFVPMSVSSRCPERDIQSRNATRHGAGPALRDARLG